MQAEYVVSSSQFQQCLNLTCDDAGSEHDSFSHVPALRKEVIGLGKEASTAPPFLPRTQDELGENFGLTAVLTSLPSLSGTLGHDDHS